MTRDEYNALKLEIPTYRASTVARASCNNLVQLYLDTDREPNEAMLNGTIYHSLILEGKLPDNIVTINADSFRNKQAQLERDEALADNKIPMLECKLDKYLNLDLSHVQSIFNGYEVEQKGEFIYTDKHTSIDKSLCFIKGTTDAIYKQGNHGIDLKITNVTTFDKINSVINWSGYDVQCYCYAEMFEVDNYSIVFFEPTSQIFQQVNLDMGYLREHVEYKINTWSLPRLEQLARIKQGDLEAKEIFSIDYEIKK